MAFGTFKIFRNAFAHGRVLDASKLEGGLRDFPEFVSSGAGGGLFSGYSRFWMQHMTRPIF